MDFIPNIFEGVLITNDGEAGSSVADFQFAGNGQVAPEYGTGSETFTRAGTPLAQDYEGVYRAVLADEVRRVGGRVVRNLLDYPEDFSNAIWVAQGGAAKEGVASGVGPAGEDAMEISFGATSSAGVYENHSAVSGTPYISTFKIRTVTGSSTVRIAAGGGNAPNFSSDITIDTNWKEITHAATAIDTSKWHQLINNVAGNAANVYVIYGQLEDATGQVDQVTPSEYVPNDTAVIGASDLFDTDAYLSGTGGWTAYGSNTIATLAGENGIEVTYSDDILGAYVYLRDSADLSADLVKGESYIITFKAKVNSGSVDYRLNYGSTVTMATVTATSWTDIAYSFVATHATPTNILMLFNNMGAGEIAYVKDIVLKEATTGLEYKTTTNGNSVASNVVTEAAGTALYPTVTKTAGGKSWEAPAKFDNWTADTVIAVGKRIVPESWSAIVVNPDEDHYFECTAIAGDAKTHATTEPTWDTTTIDSSTTVDDQVTWTYKGLNTYKGIMLEGAGTNEVDFSYEVDNAVGGWGLDDNIDVPSIDQIGITGAANTATLLTDSDNTKFSNVRENISGLTINTVSVMRLFVRKDTDTSRFPIFKIQRTGGTVKTVQYWLNTQTGATTISVDQGSGRIASHLINIGGVEWWVATMEHTDTGGNNAAILRIYPAGGVVLGTEEAGGATQGSIIVGQAEFYESTTLEAIQYSSPILTSGASASRVTELSGGINYTDPTDNTKGSFFMGLVPLIPSTGPTANQGLLSIDANKNNIFTTNATEGFYLYDDVNFTDTTGQVWAVGDTLNLAGRWDSSTSKSQVSNSGASIGSETAFDGAINASGGKLYVMNDGSGAGFLITNLAILTNAATQAELNIATAGD